MSEKTWKQLQDETLKKFNHGGDDNGMSHDKVVGATVLGGIINERMSFNICLDIGCGLLRKPHYMTVAKDVSFVGIDPLGRNIKRDFVFKAGVAEKLPFANNSFAGVCMATSLDHTKDPAKAVSEVKRVLVKDGLAFIWSSIWSDYEILEWEKRGGMWNENHQWGFSQRSMLELFKNFEHLCLYSHAACEMIFVFKKV